MTQHIPSSVVTRIKSFLDTMNYRHQAQGPGSVLIMFPTINSRLRYKSSGYKVVNETRGKKCCKSRYMTQYTTRAIVNIADCG